jgi:hypothetical protein
VQALVSSALSAKLKKTGFDYPAYIVATEKQAPVYISGGIIKDGCKKTS